MKHFLFVCSQNRLRSPTAEHIFANHPGIEVSSAGTNNDAENPLTAELVEWADTIFVMERAHRNKLQKRFRSSIGARRIVCLNIPDDYEFMDPVLISLLKARMTRHLPMSVTEDD
ncbi:low molecular weight protein tyrosine phosphatase family protein [Sphingomonas asaccharolytica]|uniref:low molecular weight protein tyrosine phosphatase family protein n=1 Tax=Sphingomonas asaccharolytica TaxID=40681 RepID=UPI00082DEE15|nr:low molecular weight protein tyrosine phosphatase family protein [Sphingomonas asaccharolytica]